MPNSDLIVSDVGRFVQGSITQLQKTDHLDRPLSDDKWHHWFGVAFPKASPVTQANLQAIQAHAFQEFAHAPHIQNLIQQFNLTPKSGFSWKIRDGDAPDENGVVNKNTAGCWIFGFRTSFPVRCVDQQNADIPAENILKGYFVQMAFSTAGNKNTDDTAGLYLNPSIMRLIAFGEVISEGISADQAFAGHAIPTQLPPGASLTPLAPGPLATPQAGAPSPALGHPPMQQGLPGANPTAPASTPLMTGYPTDPNQQAGFTQAAGVPVQPHPTFADGPQVAQAPAQQPMAAPGMQQPMQAPQALPGAPVGTLPQ